MTQPTNAELDRFMAEEVMGFELKEADNYHPECWYTQIEDGLCVERSQSEWHPTTDIAQVIGCVEKLAKDNILGVEIDILPNGFVVRIKEKPYSDKSIAVQVGDELAFTICLALYEAMKGGEK